MGAARGTAADLAARRYIPRVLCLRCGGANISLIAQDTFTCHSQVIVNLAPANHPSNPGTGPMPVYGQCGNVWTRQDMEIASARYAQEQVQRDARQAERDEQQRQQAQAHQKWIERIVTGVRAQPSGLEALIYGTRAFLTEDVHLGGVPRLIFPQPVADALGVPAGPHQSKDLVHLTDPEELMRWFLAEARARRVPAALIPSVRRTMFGGYKHITVRAWTLPSSSGHPQPRKAGAWQKDPRYDAVQVRTDGTWLHGHGLNIYALVAIGQLLGLPEPPRRP